MQRADTCAGRGMLKVRYEERSGDVERQITHDLVALGCTWSVRVRCVTGQSTVLACGGAQDGRIVDAQHVVVYDGEPAAACFLKMLHVVRPAITVE
jgi:hypothetical protein